MPFYLSEFTGAGTRQDPFVPVGSDQDGWSCIDLRPDGGATLGGGGLNACLLRVPAAFSDARARFLADDKLENLTNPQRNFLQNRLGIDLSSTTLLRDIIATIMTLPPSGRWKAITPGLLQWEVWLGELIWSAPRASGGSTDNFNRADETPIAAPWTLAMGTMPNLSSNAMSAAAATDTLVYYSGAASSADQYAQSRCPVNNPDCGPAVRVSAAADDAYFLTSANVGNVYWKSVGGSISSFGSTSFPAGVGSGSVEKLEVSGSTLLKYENGTPGTGATDTSISAAGNGVGAFLFADSLDDWEGGDIAGPPQELRPDADVTTTGWTTTPLWSKIEETSADGTVITATAS